jgi:putative inorganic carbon (HCO3(-)) transporter
MHAPAQPRPKPIRTTRTRRAPAEKAPAGYKVALIFWVMVLFEPVWWVAYTFDVLLVTKLLVLCMYVMALFVLARIPKRLPLAPLLALTVFVPVSGLFAQNPQYVIVPAKAFALYYVLLLGMVCFVKTPRRIEPFIVLMLFGQFLWWGLWGAKSGRVYWHSLYGNYDGFGPLMVLGVAGAYHAAMSLKNRRLKFLAIFTAILCVGGVISAEARGAVLSMAGVLLFMWWRSPRKGMMTAALGGALLVVALVASVFMRGVQRGIDTLPNFWDEMATVGSGDTDKDRAVLWSAAMTVWSKSPFIGVGARNFGITASTTFAPGELKGYENPATLYERALHNIWVQILTEYGIIGSSLFLWLLIDFWLRNRKLQRSAAVEAWSARGGTLDLRNVALGLETMMVGFILCGVFYPILDEPWLFCIVSLNAVLYSMVTTETQHVPFRSGRRKFPQDARLVAAAQPRRVG